MKILSPLALLLVFVSASSAIVAAEDASSVAKALKESGIELNLAKHEVYVDATVCLDRGILEYLVCLPRTFEHEAVFTTKCKPSLLHLFLLAIELEPCSFAENEDWFGKARQSNHSHLRIEVEYEKDGKKQRRPISEFLVNRENKEGTAADTWIFTGSFFYKDEEKKIYAADSTGAVIGLVLEASSVVQFGEKSGIPYRGDQLGMQVNTQVTPPVGTKVRLIFSPQAEKADPESKLVQPAAVAKP